MEKITMEDLLGGNFRPYISAEDISLIQRTFKDNPRLIQVLRKILLLWGGDVEMCPEEFGKDIWMVGVDWSQVADKEAKPLIVGRDLAIRFVMGGLFKLRELAQAKEETVTERALRLKKDSNK